MQFLIPSLCELVWVLSQGYKIPPRDIAEAIRRLTNSANVGLYADPREDWLALREEDVIDPERPIVDPHHHLWDRGGQRYMIEEIAADIASGHNIVATVYVECRSMYRASGPEALRPVGEVEFANGVAAMSASGGYGPAAICAGIVGHANLLLGDGARRARGGNRRRQRPLPRHPAFLGLGCGSRTSPACTPRARKACCSTPTFRKGFACLAPLGLSFDAWLFHPQIGELTDLARAFPDTRIVLDHCGGPIGVGSYANRREEIFPGLEGIDPGNREMPQCRRETRWPRDAAAGL